MYRPKKCMSCGGKMQPGGAFRGLQNEWEQEALAQQIAGIAQSTQLDPQEMATRFDTAYPLDPNQRRQNILNQDMSADRLQLAKDANKDFQSWHDQIMNPETDEEKKKGLPKFNPHRLRSIGLAMNFFRVGLGEIAGRIERNRQNKRDMREQTALGMMNPMPYEDFQPGNVYNPYVEMGGNPFSRYAKYGGNLKTILSEFNKWSNDAPPMDMTHEYGPAGKPPSMKKGGYEIDRMLITRKILPELFKFGRIGPRNSFRYRYQMGGEAGQKAFMDYWDGVTPTPLYKFPSSETPATSFDSSLYKTGFEAAMRNPVGYKRGVVDAAWGSFANSLTGYDAETAKMIQDRKQYDALMKQNIHADAATQVNKAAAALLPSMSYRPKQKKGGIYIKPQNRGKFTEYCGGKVTGECIERGLNSDSATIRKRANFARNARKWNK